MSAQAADLDHAFELLLADTLMRIEALTERLREVTSEYGRNVDERSYRTYADAVQLLALACRAKAEGFGEEFRSYSPGARNGVYGELVSLAASLSVLLEEPLRFLMLRRRPALETLSTPFRRMTKKLVPNSELLLFPWAADSYEQSVFDHSEVPEPDLWEPVEREYGRDVQFIRVRHPLLRQDDPFQNAVIAHEIGHALIRLPLPDGPRQQLNLPEDSAEDVITVIGAAVDRAIAPPGKYSEGQLLSWVDEVACDIIAMRTVGPAFFVAFAEVTAASHTLEPERSHETHPPAQLRYRYLLEELERYTETVPDQGLQQLLRPFASVQGLDETSVEPDVVEWIHDCIVTFRTYVDEIIAYPYPPPRFAKDLPLIQTLAAAATPPAERIVAGDSDHQEMPEQWSRQLDWRSILNGVLLWHLERSADNSSPDTDVAVARKEAASLALAGIQLSEFQRRASKLRRLLGPMRPSDDWISL